MVKDRKRGRPKGSGIKGASTRGFVLGVEHVAVLERWKVERKLRSLGSALRDMLEQLGRVAS